MTRIAFGFIQDNLEFYLLTLLVSTVPRLDPTLLRYQRTNVFDRLSQRGMTDQEFLYTIHPMSDLRSVGQHSSSLTLFQKIIDYLLEGSKGKQILSRPTFIFSLGKNHHLHPPSLGNPLIVLYFHFRFIRGPINHSSLKPFEIFFIHLKLILEGDKMEFYFEVDDAKSFERVSEGEVAGKNGVTLADCEGV